MTRAPVPCAVWQRHTPGRICEAAWRGDGGGGELSQQCTVGTHGAASSSSTLTHPHRERNQRRPLFVPSHALCNPPQCRRQRWPCWVKVCSCSPSRAYDPEFCPVAPRFAYHLRGAAETQLAQARGMNVCLVGFTETWFQFVSGLCILLVMNSVALVFICCACVCVRARAHSAVPKSAACAVHDTDCLHQERPVLHDEIRNSRERRRRNGRTAVH